MSKRSVILSVVLALLCSIQAAGSAQIPLTGCLQSSIHDDAHCGRAIDGNTNQNYDGRSCTHTNSERAWWSARTTQLTHFTHVRIFNRMDCCSSRLNDFSIKIDGHVCVLYRSNEFFSERTFQCDKVGQVIRIDNHMVTPLTLCEVQVFGETVNLPSPGKLLTMTGCLQSSTAHDGSCQRAIDGNTNQNYGGQSCIHTNSENGWWQASTNRMSRITHIRIYNRLDCCSESLSDFTISVDGHECASYVSSGFFSVETFQCDRIGQVVRISNRRHSPLMMCEVQVFGVEVTTPSVGKQLVLTDCSQSSTAAEGSCQRAIDGVTNQNYGAKSCSHTNSEKGWWLARTRKMSRFTHVRIYNRLDCCSDRLNDFVVTVDGFKCAAYISTGFFSVQTFECNRVGQVLAIVNRKSSPLTLCEVQAFGDTVELPMPGTQLKLTGCGQSSVSHEGQCNRAIDGNTNQNYNENSCIHTTEEQGWWQARTHNIANITHVRIYNRLDCCSERLNDFTISVDGHECASYQSDGFFSVDTFVCNVVGQVIRIKNRKTSSLNLCEVQVFGQEVSYPNIGEHLTLTECSQSSVTHNGVCQRAMDGNINQNFGAGSCIHTSVERGWWQARTDRMAKITRVRVYNRLDCCSDSLTDFAISVDGHECASYRSHRFFSVETFNCDATGQVVRITNRRPTPLMLCEVQVFGTVVDMTIQAPQLRLTACSQSSTTHNGICDRAIDGIKHQSYGDNSCTHTNTEKGWWQARTEKTAYITQVRIYNRLDCCSDRLNDFTIMVGGHECASYQSEGFFSVKTFECNVMGQVVRIENHKMTPLTLCEVQVFGQDRPQ